MLWLWISLGAGAAAALIVLFVWFNNSCLKITRLKITLEDSPSLKIIHLSDLHGKRFGRGNSRLVNKTAKEKPDFIAMTGDIIHLYTPKNKTVA